MLCRYLRIWSFTAAAARSKSVPTFGLLSPLSTKWDLRKLACLFFPQVSPPIGSKKAIPCRSRLGRSAIGHSNSITRSASALDAGDESPSHPDKRAQTQAAPLRHKVFQETSNWWECRN